MEATVVSKKEELVQLVLELARKKDIEISNHIKNGKLNFKDFFTYLYEQGIIDESTLNQVDTIIC